MSRRWKLESLAPFATVGAGSVAGYYLVARPWHLRWGATPEELTRSMPGDELVREPVSVSTRAVTIQATPEELWPWVVQIGMGRAGFYGYRWFERLAELSISVVEHTLPELQSLEPGDFISTSRGMHLSVRSVEPNGSLVIGSHPDAPPGEATVSWSLGLYPLDGATRLVSRVRSAHHWKPGTPLAALFLQGPLHFVLERKMLLGIKQRAEMAGARHGPDSASVRAVPRQAPDPPSPSGPEPLFFRGRQLIRPPRFTSTCVEPDPTPSVSLLRA